MKAREVWKLSRYYSDWFWVSILKRDSIFDVAGCSFGWWWKQKHNRNIFPDNKLHCLYIDIQWLKQWLWLFKMTKHEQTPREKERTKKTSAIFISTKLNDWRKIQCGTFLRASEQNIFFFATVLNIVKSIVSCMCIELLSGAFKWSHPQLGLL